MYLSFKQLLSNEFSFTIILATKLNLSTGTMVIKIASANGGFGYYSLSSEESTSTTASGTPSISNGDPIKSNQQTSQDLK